MGCKTSLLVAILTFHQEIGEKGETTKQDNEQDHLNHLGRPWLRKKVRSCDLDDDDDLLFSQKSKNAPVLNYFTLPKTLQYKGKGDPVKHLNGFKTHMGLRSTTPATKCRAFYLTLSGAVEVWYTRLQVGSI